MRKPKLPAPWKWSGDVAIRRYSSKRGDRMAVSVEYIEEGVPEISINCPSIYIPTAPFAVLRAVMKAHEDILQERTTNENC